MTIKPSVNLTNNQFEDVTEASIFLNQSVLTKRPEFDPKETLIHQTLIVVSIGEQSFQSFKERTIRFITGFNNPVNMKANILTVNGGKLYPGLYFGPDTPGGLSRSEIKKKLGQNNHFSLIIEVKDA